MRLALAAAIAVLLATGAAQAERKMFIINSNASGYGVDRCLTNGEKCGAPIANAYCKSQQFKTAASYQKVDPTEITGAIGPSGSGGCTGTSCDVVAIVCTR